MHRIEITYTEDDHVKFSCFNMFRLEAIRKSIRRRRFFLALFMVVLFAFGVWGFIEEDGFDAVFHWTLAFGILVVFVLFPRLVHRNARKNHRKILRETAGDLIGTPIVMELREDGVYNQSVRGHSIFVYSTIGEITEHEGCVYVFISKGNAMFFPRDRIPRETLDAFIAELKTRMSQRTPHAPETN